MTDEFSPDDVLLPYQKAWIEDQSPLKIAEKSRRTGLTWAEAADAAMTAALSKSAGGKNHFYSGANKEMAREFIEAAAHWAKLYSEAAISIKEEVFKDEDEDIQSFVIYFASGFKVQALSSAPSNFRGRQGNATIDEAAFHDRLAEVLKAALALTMWGAKIRIISTHNGVDHLFNQLIQESRAGKKQYSVHTITLDDACGQGLYKRICQVSGNTWTQEEEDSWKADLLRNTATEEDALEEYYCVPKSSSGTYIPRSLREQSAVVDGPVLTFTGSAQFNAAPESERIAEMNGWLLMEVLPELEKLPQNQRHALGEDFARNGDLTVFAPMIIHTDTRREVPFLVQFGNVPFRQQEQALYFIADRLPMLQRIFLDARGNGQFLAEQAAYSYGALVEQVMLSQSYYRDNMPRFRAAFEDGELLVPRNEDLINDLGMIRVTRGVPCIDDSRIKTGSGQQSHGDAAMAIFLAFLASKSDPAVYEYHSIRRGAEPERLNVRKPNNEDIRRPVRATRGIRNMGGLL